MTKELKIGIFAIIIIALSIWGYKFIKGQNLLTTDNTFYASYSQVDKLTSSSPVLIRGLQVGTVTDVYLDPETNERIIVEMIIESQYRIPKDAIAAIRSTSIVGGKELYLVYDGPCNGDNCAEDGDFLRGENKGLIESMLGDDNIEDITSRVKEAVGGAMGGDSSSLNLGDLGTITSNLASITSQLDSDLGAITAQLGVSLRNLNKITTTLADNEEEMGTMIRNMSSFSTSLKGLDLDKTLSLTDESLSSIKDAVGTLETTIENSSATVDNLNSILTKLDGNDGTLGLMMNDRSLYNNLNETSTELSLLLQDFRLNPKRYVNVSVFGKKSKNYTLPEDDPAEPVKEDKAPDQ